MAEYALEVRPYRRRFRRPITNHYGTWRVREGLLLRLEDGNGHFGFGECAPLPDFGTETLEAALAHLEAMGGHFCADNPTGTNLPCLRTALDMALSQLHSAEASPPVQNALPVTALLPESFDAIDSLKHLLAAGYRHFKLKIGLGEPVKENALYQQLDRLLPNDATLRLDANGAFDRDQARHWLRFLEGRRLDWLEQPMPANAIEEMRLLAHEFSTPIALDESVTRLDDLETICARGWRGPLVIKPALIGSRERFIKIRATYNPRLVYSSAFETSIGLQYLLELAASDLQRPPLPLGLGGENRFGNDGLCLHSFGAQMGIWRYTANDFTALWERLPKH